MPFHLSSNVIYRVTLQKKTDDELFVVDTKGDNKGICTRTLAFHTDYLIYIFIFSPKIFTTILSHYSAVAPNHLPALCCPCSPRTHPNFSRQSARKRTTAQNRAKGSEGTNEQHRGPHTAG
jgi:hypothetical protein